jgi:hypothetical protein
MIGTKQLDPKPSKRMLIWQSPKFPSGRSQHALNLTTRNFREGKIKIIQLAATTDV